jgi:hypothetical protein
LSIIIAGGVIMCDVDILYQIANLKETDYKNTLILTSLVELLIEKRVITRKELIDKAAYLDTIAVTIDKNIKSSRR